MRLGTYNVESMFQRAKAMNLDTWAQGRWVLEDFARLNTLIQEVTYTEATKAELLTIMKERHKALLTQGKTRFLELRDIRRQFLKKSKGKPTAIGVGGRRDWIGWFELVKEPLKETATENTARVIGLVKADVLCVIEAEDRVGLKRFNEDVLAKVGVEPFKHVMLIDGNDDRGIDVGVMCRAGHEISRIQSHVDDVDGQGEIFSRDCAEYEIRTPAGNRLLLLVNHFKSKGYGPPKKSDAKRLRQATRVRAIYDERLGQGYEYVAVVGDLNETPDRAPLAPLTGEGSTLTDIMAHPKFAGDGKPGTWDTAAKSGKFDYILMSPKLSAKVVTGGVERHGVWAGAKGDMFEHLPMETKADAGSDHAALWVTLDL